MDEIRLRGLQFFGYHGVMPEETVTGQRFIVHLNLKIDLKQAGLTDSIKHTVDYAAVYRTVKEVVTGVPRRLIEAVAEDVAKVLLERFLLVEEVTVELEKPGAPIPGIFETVSVLMTRRRH
ncbi:dihydroneopterin aldolase [Alicyclobacillus tolerans]|uniref:7,8-dihydroneopterin aldolase n=2 Tax=Alicyclobacillus tolerans TaxID=90970 RepID=A0ABT9LTL5_9BACL|nr:MULTISPECIES: dihydroneopterin aldolase [Alicyclobacillus]MDP9727603.1 dihydroneopterin aldolase [Alicyclobacillus tengchongensis]QRF24030.1 dihydroneopterin aldolase [Alicyclobacillus sp. TC]SHJ64853.1 dihydroneopterin aldolase [Alicyclobacillus montanus]